MAVCSWKPLVATCGKDKSVRVWNYQEKTVDLDKTFHEEPHSIALQGEGVSLSFSLLQAEEGIWLNSIR